MVGIATRQSLHSVKDFLTSETCAPPLINENRVTFTKREGHL